MKKKFCPTCKKYKLLSEFCKRKNSIDSQCKECKNKYKRKYRLENADKILEYRIKNRDIIKNKQEIRNEKYSWDAFYYRAFTLCNNKNINSYKYYGDKNIQCLLTREDVQHLWFRDNAELMDFPQLRRKNKNQNYCIDNCEFIEKKFFQLGQNNPLHQEHLKYFCDYCEKEFSKKPSIFKHGKLHFCSNKCKSDFYSGINNPVYKDGSGSGGYSSSFTMSLRKEIRERDNFVCQNCGMTEEEHLIVKGTVLHVHHIDYDKQNSNKDNLITLCGACNNRANFNRDYWKKLYQEKMQNKDYLKDFVKSQKIEQKNK